MSINIAFRTDASLEIGTGHVMRCLTLARALQGSGAACSFITRALPGHLADRIADEGFDVKLLPKPQGGSFHESCPISHAACFKSVRSSNCSFDGFR